MPTIVIDLDGTLCDCEHRQHLAQAQQWDEFHSKLGDDLPHKEVALIVDRLIGYEVIACTGRNEAWRIATEKWLRHFRFHVDALIMRPDGDWRSDHELKPVLLEEHFGSKEKVLNEVILVLDDRDKVVEAWREYGLPCWQVRPGGY
tara:strand:- start:703 stop:1140 length:438 start_codon:yes stop_codon:yes gene_type:complete